MNFQSSFSFEDAELFSSGGTCISSAPLKEADPQSKPSLKVVGSVNDRIALPNKKKDCLEIPIEVDCKETYNGPKLHHDEIPLADTTIPFDKLAPAYLSLDDILSPRHCKETGTSFMDGVETYNEKNLCHDAISFTDTNVPSDKLLSGCESSDEIFFPRYRNETGISFMDSEAEEDGMHMALLALVDELLGNFADASFQERLRDLVVDACKRQNKPHNARLACVAGRADLVREIQSRVLPKYGFVGSKTGVKAVHLALAPYLNEEVTLNRMFATDDLLWMPPGTTARDCKLWAATMTPNIVHS